MGSLIVKASGHVWCPDSAGRDYGGFDYEKGNANVITTILVLYGEMQYVWVFWNLMFLFFDKSWINTAVHLPFAVSLFTISFIKIFWEYIKEYPPIGPPVGEALRPGQYLWMLELFLTAIVTLMNVIKYFRGPNKTKME